MLSSNHLEHFQTPFAKPGVLFAPAVNGIIHPTLKEISSDKSCSKGLNHLPKKEGLSSENRQFSPKESRYFVKRGKAEL